MGFGSGSCVNHKIGFLWALSMRFRLATWNINSVRLRLDLVERLVRAERPDILCLQEIKCVDGLFPEMPLRALGFDHVAIAGQKGYHGVAILSRIPFSKVSAATFVDAATRGTSRSRSMAAPRRQSRSPCIMSTCPPAAMCRTLRSIQNSATSSISSKPWRPGLRALRGKRSNRMILVGDLNVAPLETDVWSHKQLLKVVSHTPAEVERFLRVQAAHDFIDVMRRHVPAEEKLFTWWSYRNRDWRASNRGRRLDHIWTTSALDGAATSMRVLDEARDWPRTSDHVPVIADFAID